MVEEMPYFFLANTCIKLTLLVCYYHRYMCMCVHDVYIYIYTYQICLRYVYIYIYNTLTMV